MPKLKDLFPSNYLRAADFEDGDSVVTVRKIEEDTIGQGRDAKDVAVVFFKELEKGLVLNKTNAGTIGMLYGDDTDDWVGKQVVLYTTEVQFQDKMVPAIRIRSKPPRAKVKAKPAPIVEDPRDDEDEDDSSVPF